VKTILYYFSGTGNSLAAAKKIAAALGDCELVSIASLAKTSGDIVPQAERVGIISPVYFFPAFHSWWQHLQHTWILQQEHMSLPLSPTAGAGSLPPSGSSTAYSGSGTDGDLMQDSV
jgi:flavodoxin